MTGPKDPPRMFPEVVHTSGRSMAPLIRERSLVLYVREEPPRPAPGDIVVFRRDGQLVAHRLIGFRGTGAGAEFREKGDNTLRAFWMPMSALAGRAVELRFGEARRSLEADPSDRRLRLLTRWSAAEADLVELYLRLTGRTAAFRALKWILLPGAAVAVPLRRMLFRFLLGVYHRRETGAGPAALGTVLDCFRTIFRTGSGTPPALGEVEDWSRVLDLAGSLGILPALTLFSGGDGAAGAVPAQAQAHVRRTSYRAALNHDSAMKALAAIDSALSGITPYAVLKGPFLYEALYRNLFPREYEDIDILAPRGSVKAAVAALETAGYRPAGSRLSLAFLRAGHFHIALDTDRPGWPRIELHWALVDRANLHRIPDSECIARISVCRAGNARFGVLAPEDELIYLCLHASKHGVMNGAALRRGCGAAWFCRPESGNRLTWFADIGLFLDRNMESLDWQAIGERARRWNVTEAVVECLKVLAILAPDSMASEALTRLGETPADSKPRARKAGMDRAPARFLDWAMRMNPVLLIRPVRLLLSWSLFFPSPARLRGYHRFTSAWLLPWFYSVHPIHMAARLLGLARQP